MLTHKYSRYVFICFLCHILITNECLILNSFSYTECMVPLINDFASWYSGQSLVIDTSSNSGIWYDQSGANNDATISGSRMQKYDDTTDTLNELYLNGYPVLVGTTATVVEFEPVLPYQHSVFSVCKYLENGIRGRIIQAIDYPAIFGFNGQGRSGLAYEGGWIAYSDDQFDTDWVMSSQTRELYRGNTKDLTTGTGTNTVDSKLAINT